MKKNVFLTGMLAFTLAVVLAFSMAVIGCDDGSDNGGSGGNGGGGNGGGGGGGSASTLTITDIPSQYNGKYAFFNNEHNPSLIGCQSYDATTNTVTFVQISNGKVNLTMYQTKSGGIIEKYTGNDTASECALYFSNVSSMPVPIREQNFEAGIGFLTTSITFSNGSATVSANDGTLVTF